MKKLPLWFRVSLAICGSIGILCAYFFWWPASERHDPRTEIVEKAIKATGLVASGVIVGIPVKQECKVITGGKAITWNDSRSHSSMHIQSQSQCQSVNVKVIWEEYEKKHPELKTGERLETNCAVENFGRIPYRTKRAGKIAYDVHGREIGVLGGQRYIPVFIQQKEWQAVRQMAKEGKFPLHLWSRNTFFADAEVTLVGVEGCSSDGKEMKKTFRLKREKSLGKSWENQMTVPTDFCLLEVIVKPKGKKAIKFMLYKKMEEGSKVNILLSSLPQSEIYTRPRLNVIKSYKNDYRWPATTYEPQSINQHQNQSISQPLR